MGRSISLGGLALLCAVLTADCGGGGGGGGGGSTPPPAAPSANAALLIDPTSYGAGPDDALTTPNEGSAVTVHTISVAGTSYSYTATAGHLNARAPLSGDLEASFFYVAYTLNGTTLGRRPVTFFYNGGPGSASLWLHLGSFGPRRLVTGDPSNRQVATFPIVDNADTLLPVTDMVFVDAVGTGYSEAIAPYVNRSFWGVDADAAVFRDFVVAYLAANGRSDSPKFLFGESYGTLRSALLAHLLIEAGVDVAGVVLQSSILDYNTNCGVIYPSAVSCAGYIPSYGEIGGYYALDHPNPTDLGTYADQLESFTASSYVAPDNAFLATQAAPPAGLSSALQSDTGIAAGLWQQNLNLDPGSFQAELIAADLIGRYDARVAVAKSSALAAGGDPSSSVLTPGFSAAATAYLPDFLHYSNASTYVLLGDAIDFWNFSHDGLALPDSIPDLAAAFSLEPALQVLSLNGYHDLATPFYQTELDLARLDAPPGLAIHRYAGGHMTYLDDQSRPLERADIMTFFQAAGVAP